eukprot:gene15462-17305_t
MTGLVVVLLVSFLCQLWYLGRAVSLSPPGSLLEVEKRLSHYHREIKSIASIWMSHDQDLFIADIKASKIYRVSSSSPESLVVIAHLEPDEKAVSLSGDNDGNLYYSEFMLNRIQKILLCCTEQGSILVAGKKSSAEQGFTADGEIIRNKVMSHPSDIFIDQQSQDVYYLEVGVCSIRRISSEDGRVYTIAGTGYCERSTSGDSSLLTRGMATSRSFFGLRGLFVNNYGDVYSTATAETGLYHIIKITQTDGNVHRFKSLGSGSLSSHSAVSIAGGMYSEEVYVLMSDGEILKAEMNETNQMAVRSIYRMEDVVPLGAVSFTHLLWDGDHLILSMSSKDDRAMIKSVPIKSLQRPVVQQVKDLTKESALGYEEEEREDAEGESEEEEASSRDRRLQGLDMNYFYNCSFNVTGSCNFTVCTGYRVYVTLCDVYNPKIVCNGDTTLDVYGNGVHMSNDDSCGICSNLTFISTGGCQSYQANIGCIGNDCSGNLGIVVSPATATPTAKPTFRPSTRKP